MIFLAHRVLDAEGLRISAMPPAILLRAWVPSTAHSLHPGNGSMIGHVLAPKLFVKDSSQVVSKWNTEVEHKHVEQSMICREERTGLATALSMG